MDSVSFHSTHVCFRRTLLDTLENFPTSFLSLTFSLSLSPEKKSTLVPLWPKKMKVVSALALLGSFAEGVPFACRLHDGSAITRYGSSAHGDVDVASRFPVSPSGPSVLVSDVVPVWAPSQRIELFLRAFGYGSSVPAIQHLGVEVPEYASADAYASACSVASWEATSFASVVPPFAAHEQTAPASLSGSPPFCSTSLVFVESPAASVPAPIVDLELHQVFPDGAANATFVSAVLKDSLHAFARGFMVSLLAASPSPLFHLRFHVTLQVAGDWVVRSEWVTSTHSNPRVFVSAWPNPQLSARGAPLPLPTVWASGKTFELEPPTDLVSATNATALPQIGVFPFVVPSGGLTEEVAVVVVDPFHIGVECLGAIDGNVTVPAWLPSADLNPSAVCAPVESATPFENSRVHRYLTHEAKVVGDVLHVLGITCRGDLALLRFRLDGSCAAPWVAVGPVRTLVADAPPSFLLGNASVSKDSLETLCPDVEATADAWRLDGLALWWTGVRFAVQSPFAAVVMTGPEGAWIRFTHLPEDAVALAPLAQNLTPGWLASIAIVLIGVGVLVTTVVVATKSN